MKLFLVWLLTYHAFAVLVRQPHNDEKVTLDSGYVAKNARDAESAAGHWDYDHPDAWKEEYPDCGGPKESPIDIDTTNIIDQYDYHRVLEPNYTKVEDCVILNNGHTFQVNGNFGTIQLPDGVYDVLQFHFHMPSEHTIDGKAAVGEMHIVHQKRGSTGTDDLAVIGILLEEKEEEKEEEKNKDEITGGKDQDVTKFFKHLGFASALPVSGKEIPLGGVNLDIFKGPVRFGYYHYFGSLTTPPCSMTVHWYILEQTLPVTKVMVDNFSSVLGIKNNRPVNDLNGRQVVHSMLEDSSSEFTGPQK